MPFDLYNPAVLGPIFSEHSGRRIAGCGSDIYGRVRQSSYEFKQLNGCDINRKPWIGSIAECFTNALEVLGLGARTKFGVSASGGIVSFGLA